MLYDWPRFWIPQTGILDLSDAGFLRDPVDSLYGSGSLRTLTQLETYPALALLGEPGIGKSATLTGEHDRVSCLPPEQGVHSVYVDLNATSSEDRLYRHIFETAEMGSWKAGDTRLCLHLDSLDEAMFRIETVPHLLSEGIRKLPADRLSLRIACRTAIWPAATLGRTLMSVWGESRLGVFELAPLRRRDVLAALLAHDIDPDEFISKLFGAQAVAFAIKPLTLKMLVALYKRDGRFPTSTGDLYRQGCLALCDEQNVSRRETRRQGQLNARQRLRIAGRIAVATTLGDRFAIWNGPETETPEEDVTVSALGGAREDGDIPTFTARDDDVREVLDTGLFSARGERRMGWAHQTYQEFLAANYLVEKGVPAQTILKAITHPSGGLIPPLAIIGAWAASLSPEVRASLIRTDPWTLLRGDLTKWAAADLAALIDSLLAWVEQNRHFEYFFGVTETYERLKHPGLSQQLRAVITDRSRNPIARRIALSIAERCELNVLQPDLLQAAQDRTEHHMVRSAAIAALRQCGDASVPGQILSMLQSGLGADPHDDIRGYALDLLWPNHISAAQLFSFLAPSNEHYVGSYAHFLFDLPDTLKREHLGPALEWATADIQTSNLMGEFRDKTLADAIMFSAWEVFEDPTLTGPFLEHMAARLHQHGELCRGTNTKANEAFTERLLTDTDRRRQFVLRLSEREMDRLAALPYTRKGFVRNEDFEWLIAISPGGSTPDPQLSEQTLCSLISLLFSYEDNDQFELIYSACANWPLLRTYFGYLLDGVAIDSADANNARAWQEQMQELQERRPPPAVEDLPAEIEGLLLRAERGEWQAWWQLNLALMLTPDSRGIGDELSYFITNMPGWLTGSDAVRRRIVATATRYLNEAESSAKLWLGQQPMRLQRNDLAALRAFILLLQMAPDDYAQIPVAAWDKWAPVIVGLPRKVVADGSIEIATILHDSLTKAPAAFIASVKVLISMDKDRTRGSTEPPTTNRPSSFFILHDLEGCWADQGLKDALFEELQASDLSPAEYAALLDALLKAVYEPAIEHAVAQIADFSESTLAIADVLLHRAPAQVWPILWPKLVANEDLARALLTHAASRAHHAAPFYTAIGATAVADLYLLMVRLFPPEADSKAESGLVSPLDMVPYLRDGTVRYLAATGTAESVQALMRLAAARPDIPLLPFELSRGEVEMRLKTWSPLTVKEVLALTDRPSAKLISSPADLLETLLDTLGRFADDLHGAQTPVRDLWDRQGKTNAYQPLDENGISDVITRFLRHELASGGIFANREVEVRRRPGDPVGKRTDILVNTVRRGPGGQVLDSIAAIIEVKGCWNPEAFTGLQEQLVQDYLVSFGAPVGIFLVGWFNKAHWDPCDSRRRQTPQRPLSDVRAQLDQQAAAVPVRFLVRAVVLDINAPGV
jgi:hypothetical protein